jgi:hypothetical protein
MLKAGCPGACNAMQVNVSELGLVTPGGKVVWGKYAQASCRTRPWLAAEPSAEPSGCLLLSAAALLLFGRRPAGCSAFWRPAGGSAGRCSAGLSLRACWRFAKRAERLGQGSMAWVGWQHESPARVGLFLVSPFCAPLCALAWRRLPELGLPAKARPWLAV